MQVNKRKRNYFKTAIPFIEQQKKCFLRMKMMLKQIISTIAHRNSSFICDGVDEQVIVAALKLNCGLSLCLGNEKTH